MPRKLLLLYSFTLAILALGACTAGPNLATGAQSIDVITFGSCANQGQPQPIWDAVLAERPDLFVFLGDNIYGDTTDMAVLRSKYEQLGSIAGYRRLVESTDVIATWDDHDFGANDAGAEYTKKEESKQIFLDFFGEPAGSERRLREGGVYTSYSYGPAHQRVQVILLDTRWDRSPINRVTDVVKAERAKVNAGPYTATTGPDARILGEDQWVWLEKQLRQPATVRLIATSIPFLRDGAGWETWSNFPDERKHLIALIEETRAAGVIFITGDTHHAQFSRLGADAPYTLWEVNSSGLTENSARVAPDKYRVGDYYAGDNYGLIRINWDVLDPEITMEIRDVNNTIVLENTISLSQLQIQD